MWLVALIFATNSLEPRGITRSTYWSKVRSSCISSRVSSRVSQCFGRPASSPAAAITAASAWLLSRASLPPLSTMALPLFTASEDICTSASGRLSNIIAMSPIGQLIRRSTRPSSRRRASSTFPTGSGMARRSRIPVNTSWSFFSSKERRFRSGTERPVCRAAIKSFSFARNSSSRCDARAAAI